MMTHGLKAAVVLAALAAGAGFSAGAAADDSAQSRCGALESADFTGIQDAPAQVMEARVVAAAGELPAHCHVQGYVVPQVGFELLLPTSSWNGRFIEIGCGGFCGSTRRNGKIITGWCTDALRRGYACIQADMGHASTKEGYGIRTGQDGLWAYNNLQAEIDFGFRAVHVAALAGKAITRHYYGSPAKFSYFMGVSSGGREAMVEAQRFPWDFDGIFAMDPGLNYSNVVMAAYWAFLAVTDKNGDSLFSSADLDVLHAAVLAKCDRDDGLADGVIGYPPSCEFDPGELLCKRGQSASCLSQIQVEAARKFYSGPVTSQGEKLFWGAMPGSERKDNVYFAPGKIKPKQYVDYFRYMAFMPDPGADWKAFDFDADYKRFGMMEMIYASNNPDLRKFKAAGGKLMITQGWDDSGSPWPLQTVDYYETVEKVMGGRENTQDFVRLFMMPGRAHGGGGPGANSVDYLSYLEAWVEQGRAPDMLIAAHVETEDYAAARDLGVYMRLPKDLSTAKFTRPIYPYPLQARYKGSGDPNDYRNFAPVSPQ